MKSELEQEDIDLIAQRVIQLLKPLLTGSSKGDDGDGRIFTVQTLAEYLQVDDNWVYKAVSHKIIPYFKCGKYNRFRKRAIDKWLDSQTCKPISALNTSKQGKTT
jgi:excisionase family DNA binding protein